MKKSSTSFWMATFFCLGSFMAFAYYSINTPSASRSIASSPEETVIKKLTSISQGVSAMQPKDDMSCNCQVGPETNVLTFEDPEVCGPERNYLLPDIKAFKKIDPKGYYTSSRDFSKTAEILPRKCALFIMRKFWRDRARTGTERREEDIEFNRTAAPDKIREIKEAAAYKADPHLYSKCDSSGKGTPQRYGHKACVTEDYVNLVYNSLIDVADCLGVPAKFIAPKLSNESGLHINAFGLVNDGGIGQFTDQALEDVVQNYDNFKGRITSSTKESCRRLRSIPGAVPKNGHGILTADEDRCHAISVPPNPIRSLIYYGVFYHATKRNSLGAYNRSTDAKDPHFKGIAALLKEAGVSHFNQEKIKEMLFVMAYNTGPGRPPIFFREWLKYRLAHIKKHPITKADLDMNYWPTKAQMSAKRGEARAEALGKKSPLTFAEYLFAYKDSLYIAAVKAQARSLDKGLGEGTCTEQKFLEL